MPMELRSKKTSRRSRSARQSVVQATYMEDTDESDTESEHYSLVSEQSEVMESDEKSATPRPEEEVTDRTSATGLKSCTVVLDRLRPKEETARRELEEKEEMNRKSEKQQPVSRIPTFQSALAKKRPTTSGSHNTDLPPAPPLTKKDSPNHTTLLPERDGSESWEASKAKPSGARETALPLPSVRIPKVCLETPSPFSHTEQAVFSAQGALTSLPKSSDLSEEPAPQYPLTVSARPALRASQLGDHSSENESDIAKDNHTTPLSNETPLNLTPQEDPPDKCEVEVKSSSCLAAPGDAEKVESEEMIEEDGEDIYQAKAIVDEEPPWETESMKFELDLEEEDESDTPCLDDTTVEEPGFGSVDASEESVKDSHEQDTDQEDVPEKPETVAERSTDPDDCTPPAVPPRLIKANSRQSTKKSVCSSFALFCLLPTTLLLLGGFSQHIWHYGLPKSVAHLMVQLELHWLEGFGLVQEPCSSDCRVSLVETIPQGLYESAATPLSSISDSWLSLLNKANSSVHIAAFYFTLRDRDLGLSEPSDAQGRKVFEQLMQLEAKGVKLQIAVNAPKSSAQDTTELASTGAEIREVDLNSVTGGILHTKLLVVDQKHLYLGSANMDWRSLSQVKEVGISVEDCSCLAQDASRLFGVYWSIGAETNGSLPPYWPARFSALSSSQHPLRLKLNGVPANVYLSSAPPQIAARGRSDDLTTILAVISDAQKFIHISVMDYLPLSQFTEPLRYWPAIDSVLRAAACTRGVEVQLLVSCWQHSPNSMFIFLQSLAVLNRPPLGCNINTKVFVVPSTPEQEKIPFARVNHAKYMVTDRVVYIGTSNWSENYFTQTAGVGLLVNQTGSAVVQGQRTLQSQAEELFHRDWTSQYASTLSPDDVDVCPRHHRRR